MGGVGSFMRPNRTIYVGRIHVTDDIEEIVARHFAEWGQVERIRVLNTRGVAFITYTNEANAEFAKEAMAHQSLDYDEVLNVRWATVDPNPMAQAREARRVEEQAAAAVRALLPPDYVAELEGRDPESRKRRRIEGSFALEGYDAPDSVWFTQPRQGNAKYGETAIGNAALSGDALGIEEGSQKHSGDDVGGTGGVLSGSTLAILQRQRERNSGLAFKTTKETKLVSALVNYSSDNDDTS